MKNLTFKFMSYQIKYFNYWSVYNRNDIDNLKNAKIMSRDRYASQIA